MDSIYKDIKIGLSEAIASAYNKRAIYESIKKFLSGDYRGRICILYGLKGTGKTTLMFQALSELPKNKAAYLLMSSTDTMKKLSKELDVLWQSGYEYVFVDDITLMEDFIRDAAVLSDIYSMMGMKIVIAGDESLGFDMADRDQLYDRNVMLHTTFISFSDYAHLFIDYSIDKYLECGGCLELVNTSFSSACNVREYIKESIVQNIERTAACCDDERLRIIENLSSGELLNAVLWILEQIANKQLIVAEVNSLGGISNRQLDLILEFLVCLDVISKFKLKNEKKCEEESLIISQPGMKSAIVGQVKQDEFAIGNTLADYVLFETSKSLRHRFEVFKFRFENGDVYDMLIRNKEECSCSIYEVTNCFAPDKKICHLKDDEKIKLIEYRFGTIKKRCVLYRGASCKTDDGIEYLNVEEFLKSL